MSYWDWLGEWAAKNSDGCTGVKDIHVKCCWQHDFSYQTGLDPREYWAGRIVPITKRDTDALFRQCNQSNSWFGRFSPMSWWRWVGVSLFGRNFKTYSGPLDITPPSVV